MRLSVNVAVKGGYITAGTELPADFELPSHLEAFVIDETTHKTPASPSADDDVIVEHERPRGSARHGHRKFKSSLRK
jgi:hypothetical protein